MPLRKNISRIKSKLKSGKVVKHKFNSKNAKFKDTIKKKGEKKSVHKGKGNTTTKLTGIYKKLKRFKITPKK